MTSARDLADRFHARWLHVNPLTATMYGIPGYDHLLPDDSAEGRLAWRAEAARFAREAEGTGRAGLAPADAVTLDCVTQAAEQEVTAVDLAADEHTVTAMQYSGPARFLALAARTVLVDTAAAEAYLTRVQGSGAWLDQLGDRLRAGAGRGRLPVAPLTEQALHWADTILAAPDRSPVLAPRPPREWAGTAAWEAELRAAVTDIVHPALARWTDTVRGLLPRARPAGQAGLRWLPGGEDDYARAIRIYTTLPLTAGELHQTGLDHVAALEARAVELGKALGLSGRDEVLAAIRESAGKIAAEQAVALAVAAVRRAEERAPEFFPAPLPPPCAVTPMPDVVALAGAAPHYTPPRLDGGRPGTFWFNAARPTAGTGWDIDVVAFHEAVPGHHLQLSRLQLLGDLPALQRQRSLPVFSEGWGLYAEQLAEETGLYADERGLLGAVSTALMRAVRLVVDTGLHAFGWSRGAAVAYAVEHVPMPPEFMADEIDRYIVMPGQALCYLTGKLEIERLRDDARQRLGPAFSLPAFHAAVLDHGSLPMPTLGRSIATWLDAQSPAPPPAPAPAPAPAGPNYLLWLNDIRGPPAVQVAQQRDLRAVVQGLAVDVQHQFGQRGVGVRSLGGTAGPGQAVGAEAVDAGQPRGIALVEPGERGGGVAWVVVGRPADGRSAEVRPDALAEHADDDVAEPPRDRGHRHGVGLRPGEFVDVSAGADGPRRRRGAARPDRPHARHRLPEVLLVGEAVQPRAEVGPPLPVELLGQCLVPVDAHGAHVTRRL
jgi:uncharacterized protein (DUF885 family)